MPARRCGARAPSRIPCCAYVREPTGRFCFIPTSDPRIRIASTAMRLLTATLSFLLIASACRDGLPEDFIVEGNAPPPYSGVSTAQLNVYANKTYIDLLGRGPTESEREDFVAAWRANEGRVGGLDSLLAALQATDEAWTNLDLRFRDKLLNGTDSASIALNVASVQAVVNTTLAAGDTVSAQFLALRLDELIRLRDAMADLRAGAIGWPAYVARHLDNAIFMEINMGSLNYALATFEDLYFREPTVFEREQSVLMIDGLPGFLFGAYGDSRKDFVAIATAGGPFAEGLVLEAYAALLGRRPDSAELGEGLTVLGADTDYRRLLRHVMQKPAYAGF
jgi:hypothetical protein